MVKNIRKQGLTKDKNLIPYINKPGIVLSFDDSYRVNDWVKYGKDLFGYYDVKVTFNINAIHPFDRNREHTQKEIDMLLELQANGHEIAHHGFNHRKASEYSNANGINKWVSDEIESLLNWMVDKSHSKTKERFKRPVSFAFPNFSYIDENILALIPKFFKIVRGHLIKNNLASFNNTGIVPSICIDGFYSCNFYYIKKIMKLTKKTNMNLILTCHSILPENADWNEYGWGEESVKSGNWRTSPETLKTIIDEARKNEFEFYTTAEIAGVATFIDPNFEKTVREIISNPTEKWVSISNLIPIKELDLSNKSIRNLDGIQYFINLEKLNLSNNEITDFRLLQKLPKLKKINVENNPLKNNQSENVNSLLHILLIIGINAIKFTELSYYLGVL